jgi:hypothetical protein
MCAWLVVCVTWCFYTVYFRLTFLQLTDNLKPILWLRALYIKKLKHV